MRNILFHIGYPKCLSTSIQRSFFEKSKSVFFGGIGIKDNISYCNPDIEFIFECLLKYAKHSFYNKHKEWAKQTINTLLERVDGDKSIAFSSEALSVSFTGQMLDLDQKLERIKELYYGFNTNFLIIVRNQPDLLKSLYKDFIRNGSCLSYSEFIKYLSVCQDKAFCTNLTMPIQWQ